MLIGYARISKADGSQSLDLQRDALREAGVSDDAIYEDQASGQREDRPGLAAFLKAARQGDVIVVWRLDRLGRNLRHLLGGERLVPLSVPSQHLRADCAHNGLNVLD